MGVGGAPSTSPPSPARSPPGSEALGAPPTAS